MVQIRNINKKFFNKKIKNTIQRPKKKPEKFTNNRIAYQARVVVVAAAARAVEAAGGTDTRNPGSGAAAKRALRVLRGQRGSKAPAAPARRSPVPAELVRPDVLCRNQTK